MLATLGVVLGAAYMLWLTKRVIFGEIKNEQIKKLKDTNRLETTILATLAFLIVFFGFYPEPLIDTVNVSVDNLIVNYEKSLNEINLAKMIENLNILLPELFLTISIFTILMIGVFVKNSFNLVFYLSSIIILLTIFIILNSSNQTEKIFLESFIRDSFQIFLRSFFLFQVSLS